MKCELLCKFCVICGLFTEIATTLKIGVIGDHYHRTSIQTARDHVTELGLVKHLNIDVTETIVNASNLSTIKNQICYEVRQQVDVLVVITECSKLRFFEKESIELTIPLIAIHNDPCHGNAYDALPVSAFRIQPSIDDVVDVLASLVDYGDFTKVAVIFDVSVFAGIHKFRHELNIRFIENSFTQIVSKEQTTVTSWLYQLKELSKQSICVVVLLDDAMTVDLLKQWSFIKAASDNLFWIAILSMVSSEMFKSLDGAGYAVKIIVATPLDLSDLSKQLGLYSTNTTWPSNFTISDAYLFDSIVYLAEVYNDVINANQSNDITTTNSFCDGEHVNRSRLSQNIILAMDKVQTNKTLVSPISFNSRGYNNNVTFSINCISSNNGTLSLERVGSWTTSGLAMSKNTFSPTDHGLDNMTFRIGTNEAPPFTVFNQGQWSGICIDILNELAARLNFHYELVSSEDKLWGASDQNGVWNGIVDMTMRGDCDFGVGPFSLSAERESVIDFTKPFMEDGSSLIMKRFEDKTSKMFRTFKPFSTDVWVVIAASIIVVGIILCIVNYFSPTNGRGGKAYSREPQGLSDNLWIVYGSYMEQGAEKTPANISGRFILGFWWVFTILMVASYTANLAAFLTISFSDLPIRSLEDLAKQSQIRPLVKSGSNLEMLFKKGETKTHRKIWEMLKTSPRVTNNTAALGLVRSGHYAFMSDTMQLKLLKTEDCDNLMIAESTFNVVGLGFIMAESSPLLELLSVNIIKLLESGLIEKWKQKWFSTSDKLCTDDIVTSSVTSLELESTVGPFLVFAVSTAFALICLALEHIIFRVTKWRSKNKSSMT